MEGVLPKAPQPRKVLEEVLRKLPKLPQRPPKQPRKVAVARQQSAGQQVQFGQRLEPPVGLTRTDDANTIHFSFFAGCD